MIAGLALVCGMICAVLGAWVMLNLWDPNRALMWRRRCMAAGDWIEGTALGRAVDGTLGRWLARRSMARHIIDEQRERALRLARRYELAEEGAQLVAARRGLEDAAEFARVAGDAGLAQRLYRRAYDAHMARGRVPQAAAAAERGGLYKLALRAWARLPESGGVRQIAQLSERMGHLREAMAAYLEAGCGGDALRVAVSGRLLAELCGAIELREDPALWRTGAEAAVRLGQPARAVELCLRAGDLDLARTIAREAGLTAAEREIDARLRQRRAERRRDVLYGDGHLDLERESAAPPAAGTKRPSSGTALLAFAE